MKSLGYSRRNPYRRNTYLSAVSVCVCFSRANEMSFYYDRRQKIGTPIEITVTNTRATAIFFQVTIQHSHKNRRCFLPSTNATQVDDRHEEPAAA